VEYGQDESQAIPVRVKPPARASAPKQKLLAQPRFWGTLAHVLSPVMFLVTIFLDQAFVLMIAIMVVTGSIYFYYRQKPEHRSIARQARQALAAQLMGTFGWLALIIAGTLVWVLLLLVSLLLIIVLVGLILTPLVAVAYPIFLVTSIALPLGVAVFGILGAWETWHGRDFRYPYLGAWLDKRFGDMQDPTEGPIMMV
jgi:uncharacterized Tic20 family protein